MSCVALCCGDLDRSLNLGKCSWLYLRIHTVMLELHDTKARRGHYFVHFSSLVSHIYPSFLNLSISWRCRGWLGNWGNGKAQNNP